MRAIAGAVVAGLVGVLLVGQPALGYTRQGGTGSGAATVTAGQALTVSGTTATFSSSAKTSDPAVPVTATVSNPNAFHRFVHTVTAVFRSSSRTGCGAGDYQVNGSPKAVNQSVSGNHTLTVTGVTVSLVTGGCKNSTVTLTYTVG